MNVNRTFFRALLVLFLGATGAKTTLADEAGVGGRNSFEFLKISPVARSLAMGDAYTAAGDDIGSVFYNPAGLASCLTNEFNVTYLRLYQSIDDEFIAFAHPMGSLWPFGGVLALSAHMVQYGSTPRALNDGRADGTYSAGEGQYNLAFARQMTNFLHAGIAAKYLRQQIDTVVRTKVGVDAGVVLLPHFEGLRVGLSIRNLGGQSEEFDLPMILQTGISYRRYQLFHPNDDGVISLQGDFGLKPLESDNGMRLGAEYNYKWVGQRASVRAGYKFLDQDVSGVGFTAGAGYGFDAGGAVLFLDYAYAPGGIFGSTHRVSLTTKF
jgi:hypothetical protein